MPATRVCRWLLAAAVLGAGVGWVTLRPAWGQAARSAGSTSQPATATAPATRPAEEPLKLTVSQAILMALENNKALAVEWYNPDLYRAAVEIQRAVFDPNLTASLSGQRTRTDNRTSDTISKSAEADIGLSQYFPTGTDVDLALSTDATYQSGPDDWTSRVALSVTQPLLRGFGTAVNLVSLRQSRIDVATSEYELRAYAETLVADVEKAYWDYVLARQKTEILVKSLQIAERQLYDTEARIQEGKLARGQRAAAVAEVELRKEELITARHTEARAALALLRLLSPPGGPIYVRGLEILDMPTAAVGDEDLGTMEQHVAKALRQRPDLNQARLAIHRNDLEIVETRNGLLPKMDLFITLGRTGYANSFGSSADEVGRNSGYDVEVGVNFEYPPLNRNARATHRRAVLTRDQSAASLENLADLAEHDVRSAYHDVLQTREQIPATAATRKSQEEALRVEAARLQVGMSTSLLVNIAQRDLLSSQVGEVEAVVDYLKAMVDLRRLEGSLLEHHRIVAPGGAPAGFVDPLN